MRVVENFFVWWIEMTNETVCAMLKFVSILLQTGPVILGNQSHTPPGKQRHNNCKTPQRSYKNSVYLQQRRIAKETLQQETGDNTTIHSIPHSLNQ